MNRSIPLSRMIVRRTPLYIQQRDMSNVVSRTIGKIINTFSPKRTTVGNARSLLHICKNQAENPHWHTRGLVETDFRAKQILLMVHVWMIHKRLLAEGKDGQLVQEGLFDELWEDTTNRIRGQGIGEMSVNKHLKQVQAYSFRICVELDHVLSLLKKEVTPRLLKAQFGDTVLTGGKGTEGDDEEDRVFSPEEVKEVVVDEIGGVLWRLVYLKNENLNTPHIMEFAKYVWSEQQSLLGLSREAIFDSRVQWGPLPDWKAMGSTSTRGDRSTKGEKAEKTAEKAAPKVEQGEWREAVAVDGKVYYWNTLTRQTTWEKPKVMDQQP